MENSYRFKDDVEKNLRSAEFWSYWVERMFLRGVPHKGVVQFMDPIKRDKIVNSLLDGSYRILPPHVGYIPKDDGTLREVLINTAQDRVILGVINGLYQMYYGRCVHDRVKSYTSGIGIRNISRDVAKSVMQMRKENSKAVGVKLDVSKYFDSVKIESIEMVLKVLKLHPGIDKVVWDYYHDNRVLVGDELKERYKSLGQGSAVSAYLANVILRNLDERLAKSCKFYMRYSDDILMFSDNLVDDLKATIEELEFHGLTLKPSKIVLIESVYSDFTFLGMRFNKNGIGFSQSAESKLIKKVKNLAGDKRKLQRGGEVALRRYISRVMHYLYECNLRDKHMGALKEFSWADYYFSYISDEESVIKLDQRVKDTIRAMYTGRWNSVHNMNKVSNELLRSLGYKSMHHMFKCYHINGMLYRYEVARGVSFDVPEISDAVDGVNEISGAVGGVNEISESDCGFDEFTVDIKGLVEEPADLTADARSAVVDSDFDSDIEPDDLITDLRTKLFEGDLV